MKEIRIDLPRLTGMSQVDHLLDPHRDSMTGRSIVVDGTELGQWTPLGCVSLVRDTIGPGGDAKELSFLRCPSGFVERCRLTAHAYSVTAKMVMP